MAELWIRQSSVTTNVNKLSQGVTLPTAGRRSSNSCHTFHNKFGNRFGVPFPSGNPLLIEPTANAVLAGAESSTDSRDADFLVGLSELRNFNERLLVAVVLFLLGYVFVLLDWRSLRRRRRPFPGPVFVRNYS